MEIREVTVKQYVANDGKIFEYEHECLRYEDACSKYAKEIDRFLDKVSGEMTAVMLSEKHKPEPLSLSGFLDVMKTAMINQKYRLAAPCFNEILKNTP